jgi:hypothetical protein
MLAYNKHLSLNKISDILPFLLIRSCLSHPRVLVVEIVSCVFLLLAADLRNSTKGNTMWLVYQVTMAATATTDYCSTVL